jgi:hypothetical protein
MHDQLSHPASGFDDGVVLTGVSGVAKDRCEMLVANVDTAVYPFPWHVHGLAWGELDTSRLTMQIVQEENTVSGYTHVQLGAVGLSV